VLALTWNFIGTFSRQLGLVAQNIPIGAGERLLVMQISSLCILPNFRSLQALKGKMAEAASHPALKEALVHHREQTEIQKGRLPSLLQKYGADPTAHTDQAMHSG
jgi:hypothetical protein